MNECLSEVSVMGEGVSQWLMVGLKQWFSKWGARTPRGPRGGFIIPLVKRGIIYFHYNTTHN